MSAKRERSVGDEDKAVQAKAVQAISAYLGGYYALEKQQIFIFELFYPSNAFKAAMKEVYEVIQATPEMTPDKALKAIFDAFNRVAEKNTWLPLRRSAQQPVVAALFRILDDADTRKYSVAALRSLDSRSFDRLTKNMAKFGVLEGKSFVLEEVKATRQQGAPSILRRLGNPETTVASTKSAVQVEEKIVTPARNNLVENIKDLQVALKLDSTDKEFMKILSAAGNVQRTGMTGKRTQFRNALMSDLAKLVGSYNVAGRFQNDKAQLNKVEEALKVLEKFLPGLTSKIEGGIKAEARKNQAGELHPHEDQSSERNVHRTSRK